MTVARLREEMDGAEYMRWSVYYGRKAQRTAPPAYVATAKGAGR